VGLLELLLFFSPEQARADKGAITTANMKILANIGINLTFIVFLRKVLKFCCWLLTIMERECDRGVSAQFEI
jgi:hypothetical protein